MKSINYYAGRVATYIGYATGLATALTPIIADTNWEETAGILTGGSLALVAIRQFIIGAQKHEDRIADPNNPVVE